MTDKTLMAHDVLVNLEEIWHREKPCLDGEEYTEAIGLLKQYGEQQRQAGFREGYDKAMGEKR